MGCSFANDFGASGDVGGAVFAALGVASAADFGDAIALADLPADGAIDRSLSRANYARRQTRKTRRPTPAIVSTRPIAPGQERRN